MLAHHRFGLIDSNIRLTVATQGWQNGEASAGAGATQHRPCPARVYVGSNQMHKLDNMVKKKDKVEKQRRTKRKGISILYKFCCNFCRLEIQSTGGGKKGSLIRTDIGWPLAAGSRQPTCCRKTLSKLNLIRIFTSKYRLYLDFYNYVSIFFKLIFFAFEVMY
jgi:hypothetical protein